MYLAYMFLFKQDAAIEISTKIIQEANKFGVNFDNKTFRKIFKGIYVKVIMVMVLCFT